ncbi:MAG: four helix bundle protein [Balneola sp.]
MEDFEQHHWVEESGNEYNPNKDFQTLKAWQKARDTKLFFYKNIVPLLPKDEKFGLSSQIKRASISITANIAEGYGRFHYQEGIQFYRISRGSVYELKDHLISCHDLNFIDETLYKEGLELIEEAKRLISGFINYQIKQKKG